MRLHLFEFHDLRWFPEIFRDAATSYLRFLSAKIGAHEAFAIELKPVISLSSSHQMIDLCSGGGGPIVEVVSELQAKDSKIHITLTDLYPNLEEFKRLQANQLGVIDFIPTSLDATQVDPSLKGVRTLFNSFHHFRPRDARKILANAVAAGQPIAIFELSERTFSNVISFFLIPMIVLLVMPWLRPLKWQWLLFTYIIPIIPIFIAWDGLVSHLRAYSPQEFNELVHNLPGNFEWRVIKKPVGKFPAFFTAFIGVPR